MQSVVPGPMVVIFGASPPGQALVRVLAPTRFQVVVVEDRPERIAPLPDGVALFDGGWEPFMDRGPWGPHTFAVVMTRDHDLDARIVAECLKVQTAYVGLIGSRRKWAGTQNKLAAWGAEPAQIQRVRCPIGLDLGGKEPGDIAVSIAAELMQRFHALPPRAAPG
ncbi:MAG: XdhC family protein [Myxococcota bacterium]